MKTLYRVLAVLTLIVVLIVGNERRAIATIPADPTPLTTANAPALVDETRPAALPDALRGHWLLNDGKTHAYFGTQKVVILTPMEGHDRQIYHHKQAMLYEVNFVNEAAHLVNVRVATRSSWAQDRLLQFSVDRQTFLESMNILGHTVSNRWTYMDEQQLPPGTMD